MAMDGARLSERVVAQASLGCVHRLLRAGPATNRTEIWSTANAPGASTQPRAVPLAARSSAAQAGRARPSAAALGAPRLAAGESDRRVNGVSRGTGTLRCVRNASADVRQLASAWPTERPAARHGVPQSADQRRGDNDGVDGHDDRDDDAQPDTDDPDEPTNGGSGYRRRPDCGDLHDQSVRRRHHQEQR